MNRWKGSGFFGASLNTRYKLVARPANDLRIHGLIYRHSTVAKTSSIPDKIGFRRLDWR